MNEEKQPREYDLVLGDNYSSPVDGLVLGGIEGVKQRLSSESKNVVIAAVKDAINYGKEGEDLLFEILDNVLEKNLKGLSAILWQSFNCLWEKNYQSDTHNLIKYFPMLLKKSRKNWNHWREQYPEIRVDFQKVRWKKARLESVNLSNVDLMGADLTSANLGNSNLKKANLSGAKLFWTNLSNSNLTSVNFGKAILDQANLKKANLSNANCNSAEISGCNLSDANLSNINFQNVYLSYCNLRGANFSNADLRKAKLLNIKLDKYALKNADTREAIIEEQDRYYEPGWE